MDLSRVLKGEAVFFTTVSGRMVAAKFTHGQTQVSVHIKLPNRDVAWLLSEATRARSIEMWGGEDGQRFVEINFMEYQLPEAEKFADTISQWKE